ncbi:conserved unknown protein [Ectocarpus siliculosus]|uniref:DUF676 domain-containing protein n=1 Tax=Ectocarpus siliculosus TaxID=2880 RepID=D8LJW1_ECTSI|nr:conserved unknown protein [Ectocarpus siliculosus]|eukprot:CBN76012.1 conserved unknown protein [Ectocarpus siliculosus]
MGPGPSPLRPRFITPGRLRRSAFVRKGRSASMSAGTALGLISSSPDRRRAKSSATRPYRLPLSAAALEAASLAVGLATALGYAPPPVATESDRGITVRAVYRAAELLYSRHALGLRWSKGALVVAKTAAAANAAEMSTAAAAAAVAVAARRRGKGKSKGKRKKGGGAAAAVANGAASAKWKWGGANGMGSAAPSPRGNDKAAAAAAAAARAAAASDNAPQPSLRRLNSNGELEDVEAPGEAASDQGMMTIEIPLPSPSEGEEEEMEAALLTTARASKGRLEIRAVASPRVRPSAAQAAPRMVPPSPRPVPPGKAWPKLPAAAAAAAEEVADGAGDGRSSKGGGGGAAGNQGDPAEEDGAAVAWTWGGGDAGARDKKVGGKTPLPSDLRQLSRVIHARLNEESSACMKAWSAFAKSTFECGRRDLIALREEWVRDTTRAWSGQCLEITPQDGVDLVRLNQTLLDPDGFLPLRAKAGVRLKRRASPTRGGAGAGGRIRSRRRREREEKAAAGASGGRGNRGGLSNGIARLKAMSTSSGTWSDAKVYGAAAAAIPSSWSTSVTPKGQSTAATTSPWGTVSTWVNGTTPQRAEQQGWLSRIASGGGGGGGGGGSAVSSPTGSSSSFTFSGASTAEPSPVLRPGMFMHFPPPPQSLLPVFDRDLHGFDSAARDLDDRWGELPFLVVESWGGSGEEPKTDLPPQEPAPLSPMQGGDEFRLFQEIASNSLHRKKPAAAAAAAAASGSAPLVNGKASTASGGGGGGGANGTSSANGGSANTGMSSRIQVKMASSSGYAPSDEDSSPALAKSTGKPTRHQRGPKYYTARRRPPSRAPSLPSSGSAAAGGGGGGDGGAALSSTAGYSSSDDVWSGGDSNKDGRQQEANGGDDKKRTRRNEIQRRMWGKRPSWTGALIEPTAAAATAAAAAASVPGATAREGAGASAAPRTESGLNHLIVLVHGLGGRPADMALIRSYLQTLMPGAELMVASSLQGVRKDNLGVEAMGKLLAEEVHNHVTRFCPYLENAFVPVPAPGGPTPNAGSVPLSPVTPIRPRRRRADSANLASTAVCAPPGSAAAARTISEELRAGMGTPTRPPKGGRGGTGGGGGGGGGVPQSKGMLSFVCFSLGGLVARSALLEPAMVPYLTSMQCFVTLACPHLGQTSTPLSFFKTGAWAVRKLTGLQVLHELDLDDADDPRETALYRLSLSPGLERFRTIVFAANPRDGFVPLHSASVRTPPEGDAGGSSAGHTSAVSAEMAEMLMSKSQGALDTVIGRAGHMCFIESSQVAWLVSLALLPFLEESADRSAAR